ncbi:hypothetical protein QYF36_007705 [Acer negundo]|nr:hypothetical protein QYF36_007705 [Acer negundo]
MSAYTVRVRKTQGYRASNPVAVGKALDSVYVQYARKIPRMLKFVDSLSEEETGLANQKVDTDVVVDKPSSDRTSEYVGIALPLCRLLHMSLRKMKNRVQ